MRIIFLSHLDLNLYLFRLPIMVEPVKRGWDVYAVCPKGEVFDSFYQYGIKAFSYSIKRGSINPLNSIKTIFSLKKIIMRIKPDIIHTFTHQPNIYGTIAAKLSGVPYIFNLIEGLGSFYTDESLKSKIVRIFINFLYRYVFRITDKVVFVNKDDFYYFKDILPENKICIIESVGVDTNYFSPAPSDEKLKEKLSLDIDKPIVLMIGRVLKDKGVREYIEAASILGEKAVFLYAGNIDKGNKNAFLPNWKNVKYLGFRKDIKELISICDVFVLPSYREGVPRTLLEAAAMAKPIVATNAVGCKEVVDDGVNGFLVPIKDSKELAKKINMLLENAELRKKFAEAGRKKVVKEFDVRIVVEKYLKLYEGIGKKIINSKNISNV